MVVACLFLGISGGIRFWRERQFATLAAENVSPPFRLDELPRILGDWRSEERDDGQLDAQVARIAGSSDHIVRTYLDEKSGDRITVLALYGLAERVFGHKPDACYPAAGYELVEGPVDRELRVPGMKSPVRYRWAVYMKRIGGLRTYQEAYHTFFYNGEWTPDASDQWKLYRYQPAMFKIQLGRPISGFSKEVHGPSEALLGELVQEIRSRMAPKAAVEAGKTP
jgi:hypothetical protein